MEKWFIMMLSYCCLFLCFFGHLCYMGFTIRYLYGFMFVMDYVCSMYVYYGQFKIAALEVYALQGSQSSMFAFRRLSIKRN